MNIELVLADDGQPPTTQDLFTSNNESWEIGFHWIKDNVAVDLTGSDLKMHMLLDGKDSNNLIKFSTLSDGGLVITNAKQGAWLLRVPFSRVKDFKPGSYQYDVLQASKTDDHVWRRQRGTFTLDKGITR